MSGDANRTGHVGRHDAGNHAGRVRLWWAARTSTPKSDSGSVVVLLLYRIPGQELCLSCPRRPPTQRLVLLTAELDAT